MGEIMLSVVHRLADAYEISKREIQETSEKYRSTEKHVDLMSLVVEMIKCSYTDPMKQVNGRYMHWHRLIC